MLGGYLTNLLGPPSVVAGDIMAWRTVDRRAVTP